jgi:hypothetical protein
MAEENVVLKTQMELDFKKYDANTRRIKNMSRDELIEKLLGLAYGLTLVAGIANGKLDVEVSRVESSVQDDQKTAGGGVLDPGPGGAI